MPVKTPGVVHSYRKRGRTGMARKDEATKRAVAKYKKEKTKMKGVHFFPADMEILAHAEATGNFSGYVKDLIRADMEKQQQ